MHIKVKTRKCDTNRQSQSDKPERSFLCEQYGRYRCRKRAVSGRKARSRRLLDQQIDIRIDGKRSGTVDKVLEQYVAAQESERQRNKHNDTDCTSFPKEQQDNARDYPYDTRGRQIADKHGENIQKSAFERILDRVQNRQVK